MVERLFSAKLPLLRERLRVRGGTTLGAPTLLINTENGIRTVHPKKTKKHLHAHLHDLSAPKPVQAATRPKRKLHPAADKSGGPRPSL